MTKAPSQGHFDYADEALLQFDKYLSVERLAAYLTKARGDRWIAIRLYERNTLLSEALYGVVQGLEVCLRNAIHHLLSTRLGTPEWYHRLPFEHAELLSITEAKSNIVERQQPATPGRMVAELSFSFWVRMTHHKYEDSLWFKHLYRIFPFTVRRKLLHERLINLKTLRNRIAHHERILYKRNLAQDYADLLETIGWISPDVRAWVEATNCFPARYASRIPQKPKPRLKLESASTEEPSPRTPES